MSWFFLDKSSGLHAMGATKTLKRLFHETKAGHGGTLDPLATGLLPIALGKATGFIPYLMMWPKTYVFTVQWGASSTSDDSLGQITPHDGSFFPPRGAVEKLLKEKFQGTFLQKPPQYSARRVEGQRAYTLSLQGKNPDLPLKPITVYDFKLLDYDEKNQQLTFETLCGSGTYVRALGRDIAHFFQSCCYVTALRRTSVGPFSVDTYGIPWSEVQQWSKDKPEDYAHHCHPMDSVLPPPIKKYNLQEEEIYKLWSGTWISFKKEQELCSLEKNCPKEFLEKKYWTLCSDDVYACYTKGHSYDAKCVAICRLDNGYLKPFRCFYSQEEFYERSHSTISAKS